MTPFPHWILEDSLPADMVEAASHDVPPPNWEHWVRYQNAQEQKRTCRDIHRLSGETCRLFHYLNSVEWLSNLKELTRIEGLLPDPTFHGGGIHCTDPGGFLDVHIDYALHPQLKLERRLNLVLFLNSRWSEEWGGALEFWNDDATRCVRQILPKFNRMVLWEPSDIAYHGCPQPLACPPGECRKTVAVYYLAEPRSEHVVRKRALFVPTRRA